MAVKVGVRAPVPVVGESDTYVELKPPEIDQSAVAHVEETSTRVGSALVYRNS